MSVQVNEFFLGYERTNSSSDTSAICGLYAHTFLFGGPNGVQAVTQEDFLRVVPRMKAHLASVGLSETQLRNVEAKSIDSKYLLANVDWRMKIRSSSGDKFVDASATYVLMRGEDDSLSIVFQIDHHDLASLMRDQLL